MEAKEIQIRIPIQIFSSLNAPIRNQIPNALIVRLRWAFLSCRSEERAICIDIFQISKLCRATT